MKKLYESVKSFFGKIWFKIYTEKRLKRLKQTKFDEKVKIIHDKFENHQKGSVDRIKKVMYHKEVRCVNDENERYNYKINKLIEGKQHVLNVKKYTHGVPYFYEPEIVQIHNEHLDETRLSLSEIKALENTRANDSLNKQSRKIGGDIKIGKFFKSLRMDYLLNKPFKDLSLNEIRELKKEGEKAKLSEIERDLSTFGSKGLFDGIDTEDINFPTDQNINDFPIIKKILGRDKK